MRGGLYEEKPAESWSPARRFVKPTVATERRRHLPDHACALAPPAPPEPDRGPATLPRSAP
jgi:hypothetical protein